MDRIDPQEADQACSKTRNWNSKSAHKCVICGDRQNDCPGRKFYLFPSDHNRSDTWAELIGKKWIISATPNQRCVRYKVCEEHFEANDFTTASKMRLTKTAVPKLNNPGYALMNMKSTLNKKLSGKVASPEVSLLENLTEDVPSEPPSIHNIPSVKYSTPIKNPNERFFDTSGVPSFSINNTFASSPVQGHSPNTIPGSGSNTPRNRSHGKRSAFFTPKTLKIKKMTTQLYYLKRKYNKLENKRNSVPQILNSIKGLVSPMSYFFIESQLRNARVSKNGRRWSVQDKNFALRLYMHSPKAYYSLKRIFVLPSKSTLLKCLSGIELNPGFSETILNSMKFVASKLKPHDKKCIISFDEMKLKAGLSFDVKHDQIIGLENYGTFPVTKPRLATHALVFMVRGLCKKWKQVFGFFYSCESASSPVLNYLLREGISKLVNCGLEPVAVVCDQGANNQRLYTKELGITENQPFFFVQGRKIYTLHDTPHLLKSVRNNFTRYNVKFCQKGLFKVAQWAHIYEAWKFDEQMTHRFAPKLTKEHVDVEGLKTMNVKLAAQVLSQSVASILCYLSALGKLSSDATNTADFCATMNDLFDSVNGRMIKHDRPLLSAVTKDSLHLEAWEKFINFMKSIEFQTQLKHGKRKIKFPCLEGWVITLSAFRKMIPELLVTIPFILMSRFTQDALENFFSVVRRKGGNNDHPTPVDFKSRIRMLMAEHLINLCNSANCEPDEDTALIPLQVLIDNSEIENVEISHVNVTSENITDDDPDSAICDVTQDAEFFDDENVHEVNSATYVAGYITKIALKKFQCDDCKSDMAKDKSLSWEQIFLYFKEYDDVKTGLIAPSDSCMKTVFEFGKNFEKLFDLYCTKQNIKHNIIQKLNIINHDWLNCASHREQLWEHILKKYVSLMIFYKVKFLSKNINDNKKVAKKRKKLA